MDVFKKITQLEKAASDFGFRWEKPGQVLDQIRSEVNEVSVHLQDVNKAKLQEEMGDLMHAVFSLCVFCQLDVKETLEKSIDKFERRFNAVKQVTQEQGLTSLQGQPFAVLMDFWDQAKKSSG